MKKLLFIIPIIFVLFSCEVISGREIIGIERYTIEKSIKPYQFIDGTGSKYFVEIFRDGQMVYSEEEGVNYITQVRLLEMNNEAIEYIKKLKMVDSLKEIDEIKIATVSKKDTSYFVQIENCDSNNVGGVGVFTKAKDKEILNPDGNVSHGASAGQSYVTTGSYNVYIANKKTCECSCHNYTGFMR